MSISLRLSRMLAVASSALVISLLSCGGGSEIAGPVRASVAQVLLTPPSPTVVEGMSTSLTATVVDAQGNVLADRAVAWSTGTPAVASVTSSGVATGLVPGVATITATSEGHRGTSTLTVTQRPVASVSITPSLSTVVEGETIILSAVLKDVQGAVLTGRSVAWSTSSTSVATVSNTGVVTGIAAGTATISVTSEGQSGSVVLTVTPRPVSSVSVEPSRATIFESQTASLSAIVKDAQGNVLTGRTVTWSTSAPSVASVSSVGVVTALSAGSVTITATSEGKIGVAELTIARVPVSAVAIAPETASLLVGQSVLLSAITKDSAGGV